MATISVRNISKRFGATPVLSGVSLDIADGEFLTLLGPSGCGKTTLLRIIAGLEHQEEGEVLIGAQAVDDLAPKRRDIAMVFQSYALYPYMTVAENLSLPLLMGRLSAPQRLPIIGRLLPGTAATRRTIDGEVAGVAGGLGIGHLLQRRPGQLSGGQRQRVALGRAMVRRPAAFLMDEPLSNLDAKLRVRARAEIAELHRRLSATFVYVTHDQVEAMTMSDRVAVMIDGRLLQVAPPQEIYDDPASLEVARFIGTPEINILPAARSAERGAVEVLGQSWPLAVGGPASSSLRLGIRPEAWGLERGAICPRSPALTGRVRLIESLGSEALIHIGVEGLADRLVTRVEPGLGTSLRVDEPVSLAADLRRVLAFDAGTGARIPCRAASAATAAVLVSRPLQRVAEAAHG